MEAEAHVRPPSVRETMLLLAILLLWLAAAAFVVMLCRAAARSDAQRAREGRRTNRPAPAGLGLWEDPPEPAAADLREEPVVREALVG
jgi:hypothetical protein